MTTDAQFASVTGSRVGRPRRETVQERKDALIAAATRVFLRDGYGHASIDKVASEAGVSTRTIYQRFKNKADLLGAVIARLVDRDNKQLLQPVDLEKLGLNKALIAIGRTITDQARDPDVASLFRILVTEAIRFPELAAKMREHTKERVNKIIEQYFRDEVARGSLILTDPPRAAALFIQMICGELHEHFLFGSSVALSTVDFADHVAHAVDIFLHGVIRPAHPPIVDVDGR